MTKQPMKKIISRVGCITLLSLAVLSPNSYAKDLSEVEGFVDLMNKFFILMDSMYSAASNPEHAALIQMNSLEDIYKERGNLADMVPVYRDAIEKSKNPVVRRIAHMRLADALKETGNTKEAIEVLRRSIDETIADANQSR